MHMPTATPFGDSLRKPRLQENSIHAIMLHLEARKQLAKR
jgi:hypothetical protein